MALNEDGLAAAEIDVHGYVNLFGFEAEKLVRHLESFNALSVSRNEIEDGRVGFV